MKSNSTQRIAAMKYLAKKNPGEYELTYDGVVYTLKEKFVLMTIRGTEHKSEIIHEEFINERKEPE